jgi:hypothetical protein
MAAVELNVHSVLYRNQERAQRDLDIWNTLTKTLCLSCLHYKVDLSLCTILIAGSIECILANAHQNPWGFEGDARRLVTGCKTLSH